MITEEQITAYSGNHLAAPIVTKWFNEYAPRYKVDTSERIAAFLAQTIHESAGFVYSKEIASGKAYEGRTDLGNTHIGDGIRFKGRGYIQVTGRLNYTTASHDLFKDERLIHEPEILEIPEYAMLVSFWFWEKKELNIYSDMDIDQPITTKHHGVIKPFKFQTLLINGGFNGFRERVNIYNRICADLKLPLYQNEKSLPVKKA